MADGLVAHRVEPVGGRYGKTTTDHQALAGEILDGRADAPFTERSRAMSDPTPASHRVPAS